jgi:hypothetical protein
MQISIYIKIHAQKTCLCSKELNNQKMALLADNFKKPGHTINNSNFAKKTVVSNK